MKMYSKCFVCGKQMIENENSETEFDNGTTCTEFNCPHCGSIEFVYSCPEDCKSDYEYYDEFHDEDEECIPGDGLQWTCPHCGSKLCWDSDFMRSDILDDVTGEKDEYDCYKDDSVSHSCSCPHCGYSVDFIEAKPSEYKLYGFYNKEDC